MNAGDAAVDREKGVENVHRQLNERRRRELPVNDEIQRLAAVTMRGDLAAETAKRMEKRLIITSAEANHIKTLPDSAVRSQPGRRTDSWCM